MIAGVCMGLAEYFQVDPTIIRLAFVGFPLAGGSELIIYLLMWIIVP
jgi:phage shock protein C